MERDGNATRHGHSTRSLAAMVLAAGHSAAAGQQAGGASRQGAAGPISTGYRGDAPRLGSHERQTGGQIEHWPPTWALDPLNMGKTPESTEAGLCRQDASGMTTACGLEMRKRGASLGRRSRVIPDVELAMASRVARESVLRACHEAIFDLLSGLGGAESPADVRVRLLASELIREGIYLSWPPFEPEWQAQHDCA